MNKKAQLEEQPSESMGAEPGAQNIILPAHISEMLINLAQRRDAAKQQADAEFNRDASNLIIGFLAGSADVDKTAVYTPSTDLKKLIRNE